MALRLSRRGKKKVTGGGGVHKVELLLYFDDLNTSSNTRVSINIFLYVHFDVSHEERMMGVAK